jgi:hypothetical protein
MNVRTETRQRHSKAKRSRCIVCGSNQNVEHHHVGGRYHAVWFKVPLCQKHHVRLTAALWHAGVEMSFTPDVRERLARARRATLVFLWALEDILKEHEQKEALQ